MFLTHYTIVIYVYSYFFPKSWGFDNVHEDIIIETEAIMRHITSKLFSELNITRNSPKLQRCIAIHNYFTNITLMNQQTINLIVTLSRFDERESKNTSQIDVNKIFEEDGNKTNSMTHINEDPLKDIDKFLNISEQNTSNGLDEYLSLDVEDDLNKMLQSDSFEYNISQIEEEALATDNFSYLLNSDDEFWVPAPQRRIYRGVTAKKGAYPFMASIHVYDVFKCAGSIIKSDLILTAASCLQLAWDNKFFRENPSFVSIRVGSEFYDSGGESVRVLEIHFYPGYNPSNMNDNIAIVRLLKHLSFDKHGLTKIEFDRRGQPLSAQTVTIVGWGSKGPRNVVFDDSPNQLAHDVLNVYNRKECQQIYSSDYVKRKNFCAGFSLKGSGACNLDTGGPGLADGLLTGIISFGPQVCGTADAPTVFTQIGYYTVWIDVIMEQEELANNARSTLHDTGMIELSEDVSQDDSDGKSQDYNSERTSDYNGGRTPEYNGGKMTQQNGGKTSVYDEEIIPEYNSGRTSDNNGGTTPEYNSGRMADRNGGRNSDSNENDVTSLQNGHSAWKDMFGSRIDSEQTISLIDDHELFTDLSSIFKKFLKYII